MFTLFFKPSNPNITTPFKTNQYHQEITIIPLHENTPIKQELPSNNNQNDLREQEASPLLEKGFFKERIIEPQKPYLNFEERQLSRTRSSSSSVFLAEKEVSITDGSLKKSLISQEEPLSLRVKEQHSTPSELCQVGNEKLAPTIPASKSDTMLFLRNAFQQETSRTISCREFLNKRAANNMILRILNNWHQKNTIEKKTPPEWITANLKLRSNIEIICKAAFSLYKEKREEKEIKKIYPLYYQAIIHYEEAMDIWERVRHHPMSSIRLKPNIENAISLGEKYQKAGELFHYGSTASTTTEQRQDAEELLQQIMRSPETLFLHRLV